MLKRLFAALILVFAVCFHCTSIAQVTNPPTYTDSDWVKDIEPFRIAGNLYYVGTYDLACYLITTPDGHILINTGIALSTHMIRAHVEALGFKFTDIKILLATHAHYDHVGAMAEVKKLTGAQMMINEGDAGVIADGGNSDYLFGGNGSLFEPFKADKILGEHDTVNFGGMKIAVLHHPGHTKGASSFLFDVKDDKRTYKVLIANMPKVLDEANLAGTPQYPDVSKDFQRTYDAMAKLQFDLWVASHASQFKLHSKRKTGYPYNPMAFADRAAYDKLLNKYKQQYLDKLQAKAPEKKIAVTSPELFKEIATQDSLMFVAFNTQNVEQMKTFFSTDLEWFQDNGGLIHYDTVFMNFSNNFKKGLNLKRTLLEGSMEVHPIKDYGAIETASHRFTHMENGKEETGTFKYMAIWKKQSTGKWQITKMISYDH